MVLRSPDAKGPVEHFWRPTDGRSAGCEDIDSSVTAAGVVDGDCATGATAACPHAQTKAALSAISELCSLFTGIGRTPLPAREPSGRGSKGGPLGHRALTEPAPVYTSLTSPTGRLSGVGVKGVWQDMPPSSSRWSRSLKRQIVTAKLDCQSNGASRTTADISDLPVDVSHSYGRHWTVTDESHRDS